MFHDRRSKGSETEGKTKLDVSRGKRNASVTRTKVHLRLHVGALFSQIMPFVKKSHKTQNLSRIEFIPIKNCTKYSEAWMKITQMLKKCHFLNLRGASPTTG